jgi:hypothetical protein
MDHDTAKGSVTNRCRYYPECMCGNFRREGVTVDPCKAKPMRLYEREKLRKARKKERRL